MTDNAKPPRAAHRKAPARKHSERLNRPVCEKCGRMLSPQAQERAEWRYNEEDGTSEHVGSCDQYTRSKFRKHAT